MLVFMLGLAVVYVGPIVDLGSKPSEPAVVALDPAGRRGVVVYDQQGCVYCHTQQVRGVSNDLGLGTVSQVGRYGGQDEPKLGFSRVGPDLSCYGDRLIQAEGSTNPASVTATNLGAYLASPTSIRPHSEMPSMSHLSASQMTDLVSYLTALRCGEGE